MENDFNIKFNPEKTVHSVLYIVGKLDRKDFHKIFKILYFADRDLFADYGRTITGDHYIAMEAGPVPSNLYDIFKSVRGDGFFKDNGAFSQYFKVVDKNLISPQQQPNLNILSKKDIQYLDTCILKYSGMSYSQLKEVSHDYAWNNTLRDECISFENILLEKGDNDEYINFLKEREFVKNINGNESC